MKAFFKRKINKINSFGMSLLELIFGISLFTVVAFTLTGIMISTSKMALQDEALTLSTQHAQRILESIKGSMKSADSFLTLSSTPKTFFEDDPRFIYEIEIEEEVNTPSVKYAAVSFYAALPYDTTGPSPQPPDPEILAGKRIIKLGTYIIKP